MLTVNENGKPLAKLNVVVPCSSFLPIKFGFFFRTIIHYSTIGDFFIKRTVFSRPSASFNYFISS